MNEHETRARISELYSDIIYDPNNIQAWIRMETYCHNAVNELSKEEVKPIFDDTEEYQLW